MRKIFAVLVAMILATSAVAQSDCIGGEETDWFPDLIIGSWEHVDGGSSMIISPDCVMTIIDTVTPALYRLPFRLYVRGELEDDYGVFAEVVLDLNGGRNMRAFIFYAFVSIHRSWRQYVSRHHAMCIVEDDARGAGECRDMFVQS